MSNPTSDCPRFEAFLAATVPDADARAELQELLGAAFSPIRKAES